MPNSWLLALPSQRTRWSGARAPLVDAGAGRSDVPAGTNARHFMFRLSTLLLTLAALAVSGIAIGCSGGDNGSKPNIGATVSSGAAAISGTAQSGATTISGTAQS